VRRSLVIGIVVAGASIAFSIWWSAKNTTDGSTPEWAASLAKGAEPVNEPSLPKGFAAASHARAYAVCYDLAADPAKPAGCQIRSAFVFAPEGGPTLSYRDLDAPYHEACALQCPDGCFVLDGIFSRPLRCDEWREAMSFGRSDIRYELRDGVLLGPEDTDGSLSETERATAQTVIDAAR
jgi:hypothetical protein